MTIIHYYRSQSPPHNLVSLVCDAVRPHLEGCDGDVSALVASVDHELCFNVGLSEPLTVGSATRLLWLLSETFDPECTRQSVSFLSSEAAGAVLEFGPRMTFTSAFSSNATSICGACGIEEVARLERSRRYLIRDAQGSPSLLKMPTAAREAVVQLLHDRMTEELYPSPLSIFSVGSESVPVKYVDLMGRGRAALEEANDQMGLGFDGHDLEYYTELFLNKLGRNPSDVECFDMGQSNSEHSRHWFFGGKMVIDGIEKPHTLFQMVKDTLPSDVPNNSIIAFHDNSSSIRGYEVQCLRPSDPTRASPAKVEMATLHPILTAETHNFPCGVAPFPGAETGTGGRLRDVSATGQGATPVAGISAYCVGNLHLPGYDLPWEQMGEAEIYPPNLAAPLDILVSASNGASDYGNKFGEPVIHGFARSFGQRLPHGGRVEWVKPIMFSAGVGYMDAAHAVKGAPEPGMLVVKIGGPAYRIGIGGGAASSRVQAAEHASLDFDAVQRGDAEMENRMIRLMRACCDLGTKNPIVSVHDQGAGGNGNVLKEIVEPAGAEYDVRKIYVGDNTLSVLEIWGAEYQENNALLIRPEDKELFSSLANRERCPIRILGTVTGDGRVVLRDSHDGSTPVDLPLELVLGKMPQKTFVDAQEIVPLSPLQLPPDVTVSAVLDRILRLVSVGSKRFLVHKVDRSVTGLVAQQQCVGPLQLPLSNVAVTAHTYLGITGTAVACGEQPIKGLLDSAAMARITVAETITNLVWAKVSSIQDIKASGNWMYAAKLPGEGAKMYDACEALRDSFLALGCGIDGGKDSLSMAARCGEELVKAPGELTITMYVTCPDITKTVTPDLRCPEAGSRLLYVDLGGGKARCGGTALAQVYGQIGDACPDLEDFALLKRTFETTQELLDAQLILAGHDRSDGGIAVTLLEMAFAGNCSIDVCIPPASSSTKCRIETLFNEEAGLVLEVATAQASQVMATYAANNVPCLDIGSTGPGDRIHIRVGDRTCIDDATSSLRDLWEATSFRLERLQRNPTCVAQEEAGLKRRTRPQWQLAYVPKPTTLEIMASIKKPRVAVVRQEGSNGDREMIAAFVAAGFEAWDVAVGDLVEGKVHLQDFQGIAFVGGFSYADVLDSGKGWAGVIKFNPAVFKQFEDFRHRPDTFSLGVCNGCQLMALLGWVPGLDGIPETDQPRFVHNESEKFESRFSSVKILPSPAMMFKDMAGSSLGVWVAHGEGRVHFPAQNVRNHVETHNLAPLRYVDDTNTITTEYPFNPNGSPEGMAALCSKDGRHLALMPHPERVFTTWQWPYMPDDWKDMEAGPWLKMFQNAREFCEQQS